MKEEIGLRDRDGIEIREGDTVRFTVSYDWEEIPTYDGEGGTVMTDTVRIIDGHAYFCCPDTGGASFAWRHNEHCEVIAP
jgi:hypothetical protein